MSFDAARMTRLGRVQAVAPSPDGSWLAVEVARLDDEEARYVSDLWRVPLSGGEPVQLTRGGASDRSPRFRRDGALGFLSARGGDDRAQVWILPALGGEPLRLTEEPLGVLDFRFAAAADRLVVLAPVFPGVPESEQREHSERRAERGPTGLSYREMPVRFWDDWLRDEAPHFIGYQSDGSARRDLTPRADREYRPTMMPSLDWDLAPDGARLAAPAARTGADRIPEVALHVIDTESGEIRVLGEAPGLMLDAPVFAPDGRRLACTHHQRERGRCGKPVLWLFDALEGPGEALASHWDAWPTPQAWTPDGAAILAVADHAGQVPIYRIATSGEVSRLTSEESGGSHGSLHVSGDAVVGSRHRILHPPEPFRLPLEGGAPELLAHLSGFSAADGAAIAEVESFTVSGEDDAEVQSFLAKPSGGGGRKHPALVWIHGGPIGQHADGWHWRWNPLVPVAAGYAVALPNPRGSTGFGQDFIEGIWNNEWGGACYTDLMAVTEALASRDDVDGDRIGAMGGSFGGYMANWIGSNTDRFRCLVTHAGIYHFGAFHGTTDCPAFFADELGLTPYENEDIFERHSPHRRLERWKTPTLIIHGEKDFRVPVSEALLLFEGLGLQGVEAELLVFPDENHWILKPQNSRQWYEKILAFAGKYL